MVIAAILLVAILILSLAVRLIPPPDHWFEESKGSSDNNLQGD